MPARAKKALPALAEPESNLPMVKAARERDRAARVALEMEMARRALGLDNHAFAEHVGADFAQRIRSYEFGLRRRRR
jgi:hypothetical protein